MSEYTGDGLPVNYTGEGTQTRYGKVQTVNTQLEQVCWQLTNIANKLDEIIKLLKKSGS